MSVITYSHPELAMRRCVLEKGTLRYFSMGPSSLLVAEAHPDAKFANRTPTKSALQWCGKTYAVYLVHTNEQTFHYITTTTLFLEGG